MLSQLADEFYETYFRFFPGEATQAGDHRFDGELGHYSRESVADMVRFLKTMRSKVDASERDGLARSDAIDRLALLSHLDELLIRFDCLGDFTRNPGNYLPLDDLNVLVIHNDRPLEERAEGLASRLRQYPRVVTEGMAHLDRPTRVFIEVALEHASAGLDFFSQTIPDITQRVPGALKREIERGAGMAVRATTDFIDFLRQRCLPRARPDFAAGKELYDRLLREWHLLPYTGEEIIEIARSAISDTERELRIFARKINGEGNASGGRANQYLSLIERLRKEYPDPGKVTEVYAETVEALRRFILEQGIVDIPGADNLEVRVTPSFLRPFYPTNGYEPSPVLGNGENNSFYWVTLPPKQLNEAQRADYLGEHTFHIIPSVTAHETYPGHHLFSLYARACGSLIRKLAYSPLTDEGWAFYTEEMMEEQGFLETDEQRFFRRKDQLFRAVRALIDVEIHYGRLSLDAAAARLVEQVCLSPEVARSEVSNYAMGPTFAICYLIGKTEIKRMRARYLKRSATDCLREFHTRFLQNGMIPLSLIERELLT